MNCYKCKFREDAIGSAHSVCKGLRAKAKDPNHPDVVKLEVACAFGGVQVMVFGADAVKINPHGKRNGWANWPLDFDPTWITECGLYERKK